MTQLELHGVVIAKTAQHGACPDVLSLLHIDVRQVDIGRDILTVTHGDDIRPSLVIDTADDSIEDALRLGTTLPFQVPAVAL